MIRRRKFKNQLTLIAETMPHVRSVTVGIWLRQGSRHEPKRLNGISHFLEHLVFKGTETRSARDIALAADSLGMQLDAFTTKEYTCFYAKVLDEHLYEALDLLTDIVRRPRFDPQELERERKVILEEIRMVEDTPDELLYDLFSEHFYPRHSLGRPIQGTEESVVGMSRRRVQGFFRESYIPRNMLIAAAGNIEYRKLSRRIGKLFGGMDARPPASRPGARRPRTRGGVVVRRKRELEQLHLLLGLPAFPESFSGRYALYVLNALLGGTMSSRLFQRVREERGLAYSVYSAVNAFIDCGFLMVYAGTSPEAGREVVRLVRDECRDLAEHGPNAEELRVAQEHIKGSLMLSLESTTSRMTNLARQEIYHGRQYSLQQLLDGIAGVEAGHVRELAGRLFSGSAPALAAVGRTGKLRLRPQDLQF